MILSLFVAALTTLSYAAPIQRLSEVPIPDSHAFRGWQTQEGYATTTINPFALTRVQIRCRDQNLYPTHPEQSTKIYHEFESGTYDNGRLDGQGEACAMTTNRPGSAGRYFCLRPDIYNTTVISDIFTDRCGNLYRGIWRTTYFTRHESMGTLSSKGRTLYRNQRSQFAGDFISGNTYPVPLSDFMFLAAAFTTDRASVTEQRTRAQRTHTFHPETMLFSAH